MSTFTIYCYHEVLYMIPMHSADTGILFSGDPKSAIAVRENYQTIGLLVLTTLAASRAGVPIPQNPKEVTRGLLAFVGAKSWKSLERTATCLSVYCDGDATVLEPTRQEGGQGYSPLPELAVRVSVANPEGIGRTVVGLLVKA